MLLVGMIFKEQKESFFTMFGAELVWTFNVP